jgi:hypothetical protein
MCKESEVFPKHQLENHLQRLHGLKPVTRARGICSFWIPETSEEEVSKLLVLNKTPVAVRVLYDSQTAYLYIQVLADGEFTVTINSKKCWVKGWSSKLAMTDQLSGQLKVSVKLSN